MTVYTNTNDKPEVVITDIRRWSFFQWFLLGFYELREAGEIKFDVKVNFRSKFLERFDSFRSAITHKNIFKRAFRKFLYMTNLIKCVDKHDNYLLEGYMIFGNGEKKCFVIDNADSPYLFDAEKLRTADVYFKIQYPTDIDNDTFELTPDVHIMWSDHAFKDSSFIGIEGEYNRTISERKEIENFKAYRSKIKPLMIGTRRLSFGSTYEDLKKGYENYIRSAKLTKTKKIMCYFGDDAGPVPIKSSVLDCNYEPVLMGYYDELLAHPNEKRSYASRYISSTLGDEADTRIIATRDSQGKVTRHNNKIVPIAKFCEFVSNFQYNLNISGYRKSIPNRFIESFMVGTAIITDRLSVKWYLPFDPCEVRETVEMGYLPNDKVDWQKFQHDIQSLPDTEPEKIIECFNRKWKPSVVARYIIDTVRGEN